MDIYYFGDHGDGTVVWEHRAGRGGMVKIWVLEQALEKTVYKPEGCEES